MNIFICADQLYKCLKFLNHRRVSLFHHLLKSVAIDLMNECSSEDIGDDESDVIRYGGENLVTGPARPGPES